MTTALTSFYDDVLPHVPGCPQALALIEIRKACIEFFRRTWIWQVNLTPIDVVVGQHTYAYSAGAPPVDTVVADVIQAWHNDFEIFARTPDELAMVYNNWQTQKGNPLFYVAPDDRDIRIVPIPALAFTAGLKLFVSLKPSNSASGIDDILFQEYHERIADGAIGKIMLIPKKPYTDLQTGASRWKLFINSCHHVRTRAMKTRSTLTTPSQV